MSAPAFRALVETHLQPVLLRAGFAAGQWGDDGARGSSGIFCAAGDDYVHRHPQLVDHGGQWDDVYCVDIMIEGSIDGGIERFDVEFESLAALLARTGHGGDATALPALLELNDPPADLRRIGEMLSRLYDDAEQRNSG